MRKRAIDVPASRRTRRCHAATCAILAAAVLAACSDANFGSPLEPVDPAAVPVTYEFVADTVADGAPLQATTEVTNVVAFAGDLWASTSQWMAPQPVGGAILRRGARDAAWTPVLQTSQLRVMALEAFSVPAAGGDVEVLLAQAQESDADRELRWSVAPDRTLASRFALPDAGGAARSFGVHVTESGSVTFFAGVQPTGVLAGAWDADARTIRWSPTPELVAPGAGLDQKVTGFASCGGAAWVTVRGTLYRRRTDSGTDAVTRGPWQPMWTVAVANPDNSGLRGVSCVVHEGAPAILLGVEGSGEIVRFDAVDRLGAAAVAPLEPVLELDTRALIERTLRAWGHAVPSSGPGAVGYTIPAYNEFTDVGDGVVLAGVEWSYDLGRCPATRRCQPQRTFDAQGCVLRRAGDVGTPDWQLRCLATPPDSPIPVPTRSRPERRSSPYAPCRPRRGRPTSSGSSATTRTSSRPSAPAGAPGCRSHRCGAESA